MADLDDFFAKRDKKKPKGKKFETSDDVAKILETKAKERKKQETNKSMYTAPLTEDGLPAQPTNEYRAQGDEDDEWKEVIEEKPDYTGLKIGELVLNDEDSDVDANEQEGREGNEGVSNDGPWSKNKALRQKQKEAQEAQEAKEAKEAQEEKEKKEKETESTETAIVEETVGIAGEEAKPDDAEAVSSDAPKRYIPPSQRAGAATPTSTPKPLSEGSAKPAAAGGAYVPPSRRGVSGTSSSTKPKKTTAAPNIDDTNYFPSLGGS